MVGDGHWRPSIQTDPSNTFAFVPHIDNRGGPNAIFQFKFDPIPAPDAQLTAGGWASRRGRDPATSASIPARNMLYFSNEQGSSVTGYHFDPPTAP